MKYLVVFLIAASVSSFAVAQAPVMSQAPAAALSVTSTVLSPTSSSTSSLTARKPVASKNVAASTVKPGAATALTKPAWVELTAMQHQALKPLEISWNAISEPQKRKWLELSKNYQKLSPEDRATMHSRMVEWVVMSPQDRAAARLNFAKTKELSKQLTADEKKAKWETYQALSAAEKAKLAAQASPKPAGAATAVKPVELQKLAVTPKNVLVLPKLPATVPTTTASELAPGTTFAPAN